jgi:hypothetical protein
VTNTAARLLPVAWVQARDATRRNCQLQTCRELSTFPSDAEPAADNDDARRRDYRTPGVFGHCISQTHIVFSVFNSEDLNLKTIGGGLEFR